MTTWAPSLLLAAATESDGYVYLEIPRSTLAAFVARGWREVGVIAERFPALVAKPAAAFGVNEQTPSAIARLLGGAHG